MRRGNASGTGLEQEVLEASSETRLAGTRFEMPQGCLKDILWESIWKSTSAAADMTIHNGYKGEVNIFTNTYVFIVKSSVGLVDNK